MPAEQHSIKPIVTSVLFLESFSLIERKSKIPRNSSYTLRVPVSQNEVGEFCLVKTHAFLRSWQFFFVIETVCYKIIFCISFHQYSEPYVWNQFTAFLRNAIYPVRLSASSLFAILPAEKVRQCQYPIQRSFMAKDGWNLHPWFTFHFGQPSGNVSSSYFGLNCSGAGHARSAEITWSRDICTLIICFVMVLRRGIDLTIRTEL